MRLVFNIPLALCFLSAAAVADDIPQKTLAECIAIAEQQHPSLKAATASVQAGHARVWEAGSNYLPQISATYAAQRRRTSSAAFGGTGGQAFPSNFYNPGASLTQVLFDFGQTLNAIQAAQA